MIGVPIGLHNNVDAAWYHSDPCVEPSLSSSIAKVLISDTPRHAWFAHPRLNPAFKHGEDDKFSLGSVAHELILGKGGGFSVLPFDDWRTKAAREAKDEARAKGQVPILEHQFDRASEVRDAAWHRLADFADWHQGQSEVVAVWDDDGVICRAMIDRLTESAVVYDVKTTDNGLSDGAISRTVANLGYDLSAAFYVRGLTRLKPELSGRIKFRWVFAEVNEPFEVRIIEADNVTLHMGERKAAWAINKWRECMARGEWPGYPPIIERIVYPSWAEASWLEREIKEAEAA